MTAPKPLTRAQLTALLDETRMAYGVLRGELGASEGTNKDLRTKLNEVKERLAVAETENQRMRGYLERVQEDDVVREELISTGNPQGQQQLVPKRKPTIFAPQMYAVRSRSIADEIGLYTGSGSNNHAQPQHWVTY